MTYNETLLNQASNPYLAFKQLNTLSGNFLAIGLVVALWFILFISFKNYGKAGMLVTNLITTIVSFLLFYMEFVPWVIFVAPLLLFFASLFLYKFLD